LSDELSDGVHQFADKAVALAGLLLVVDVPFGARCQRLVQLIQLLGEAIKHLVDVS
jgi:hypothetical protein